MSSPWEVVADSLFWFCGSRGEGRRGNAQCNEGMRGRDIKGRVMVKCVSGNTMRVQDAGVGAMNKVVV